MGNQSIVVATDSTAYIPGEISEGFDIPVIPLWLIWGDERFRDGVDIDPPTFYDRLQTSRTFPTTSQPSAGEFEEFYQRIGAGKAAVVGVFISSKLSGTVPNALAAQARFPELPIRVVDSLSTSMGLGFAVLAAARTAAAGKSLDEVVAAAEQVKERAQVLFAVDTLEFLHRGGRIGGAKRLLGSALSIKPLLHLEDGSIEALSQVRTRRKALAHLLDVAEQLLDGRPMAEAAILQVNCPDEGAAIAEQAKTRFGLSTVAVACVSPVIGAHVGPGTIGICFYPQL